MPCKNTDVEAVLPSEIAIMQLLISGTFIKMKWQRMPNEKAPIALPTSMIGKLIAFSTSLFLSSKTTPILPVYSCNPSTQTRIKPIENKDEAKIEPQTVLKYDFTKVKTKEPRPMAKPANIPNSKTFKYFILENWFIIFEFFDVSAAIDFEAFGF